MDSSRDEDRVSGDLAVFTDPESDEVERWRRIDREALLRTAQLAQLITHKRICEATDVSKGQLSRELSENYETSLSLRTALFVGHVTQNERLAQVIVCDGLGMRMPEWQKRKATDQEWRKAFEAECREAGIAGKAIYEAVSNRVRAGR